MNRTARRIAVGVLTTTQLVKHILVRISATLIYPTDSIRRPVPRRNLQGQQHDISGRPWPNTIERSSSIS